MVRYIILLIISLLSGVLMAQGITSLRVGGTATAETGELTELTVNVINGGQIVNTAKGNPGFSFELNLDKDYILEFLATGFVRQRVFFSTKLDKSLDRDRGDILHEVFSVGFNFKPDELVLFEGVEDLDDSEMDTPVLSVKFDEELWGFKVEKNTKPKIDVKNKVTLLREQKYNNATAEAEELLGKNDLDGAWLSYNKALLYKPGDEKAKNKIAEIKKELSVQSSYEASYNKFVAKADKAFDNNDYADAIKYYNKAKLYKPEEQHPINRLKNIELSYKELIATADKFFENKSYSDAMLGYQEASQIYPGRDYPKERIKAIKEVAPLKEIYDKLIAEANSYFANKDFAKSERYYREALSVLPEEKLPQERLLEIEKFKEKETQIADLISKAEAAETKNEIESAYGYYNQASKLKPSDEAIKLKIRELESKIKEQKAASVNHANDEEYNRLIADGIHQQKKGNLEKALDRFSRALRFKPQDLYAKEKLDEINGLIALANESNISEEVTTTENVNDVDPEKLDTTSNENIAEAKHIDDESLKPKNESLTEYYLKGARQAEEEGNDAEAGNLFAQVGDELVKESKIKDALERYSYAITLLEKSGSEKEIADVYAKMGYAYRMLPSLDKSLEVLDKSYKIRESRGDKSGVSDVMNEVAAVMYDSGRYEASINYYEKALAIKEELGEKKEASEIMLTLGAVLKNTYRYEKSVEYFEKSLVLKEEEKDDQGISIIYNSIGDVFAEQNEFDNAISYYQKSLEKDIQIGNKDDAGAAMNNIGVMYYDKGDFDKSVEYYEKSLAAFQESGNKKKMALTYNNLGNVNFDWKKYAKALEYYEKSLKLKEEIDYKRGIATSLFNIGNVHKAMGDSKGAKEYYEKSSNIAELIQYEEILYSNYEQLAALYAESEDYKNAFEYFRKYAEGKISEPETVKRQISEMHSKYDEASKDFQISNLKQELDKQKMLAKFEASNKKIMLELKNKEIMEQQERMQKQSILIYSFVIGFAIILVFSVLLYRQSQQRKRANELLAVQNEEIRQQKEEIEAQRDEIEYQRDFVVSQKNMIEDQKKEITDSIVYASIIQSAMLPPEKVLEQNLPDHFVLYKPRDIVSGDFYWNSVKEDKIIFVAADCTGHGVPGAFMSMLGIATLNEVVNKDGVTKADLILNELRNGIISSLHQTDEDIQSKDGMDISICVFDKRSRRMEFAGAYNPIFICRNGELLKYKADPMPIGVHRSMDIPFTCTDIDTQRGDIVYLFSDGYADQFGGPDGKKLKIKAFKELLLSIHDKPLSEQRDILDQNFMEWKGSLDQIDDILVAGIRV